MYYTIRLSSIIVLSFIIISFVFFTNPAFGASGLKVFVNLQHNEKGSGKVCVYSYYENLGCDTINLSKYNSPTELGPWQFTTGIIPVGESFTVCVTNLDTNKEKCKDGTNTPKKAPEYVTITVPDASYSNSQTEQMFKSSGNNVDDYHSNPSDSKSNYNKYTQKDSHVNQRGINWGEICENPIVDFLISEPCDTLTTDNGYTLTSEGEKVIACIVGGGVLMLVDPTGTALAAAKTLGPAKGCGNSNSNSLNLGNLLSGFLK